MKERRAQSRLIVQRLGELPAYMEATVIYGFYPTETEVDIRPLLQEALQRGKTVALPRIEADDRMVFIRIASLEDVRRGTYNIMEPIGTKIITAPGLILVPGLGFQADGKRIGHGKGYYDRYLRLYPDLRPVAVCFREQLVTGLPVEEHDISIPQVIIGEDDDSKRNGRTGKGSIL